MEYNIYLMDATAAGALSPGTSLYVRKRDLAASSLRQAIIRGELRPGTRLNMEDLSAQFHVSLTPLREALQQLEAEGFVVQAPHRGFSVAEMDREEIQELYAIRIAIERLATRHAVPRLADADVAQMKALIDQMAELAGDWPRFLQADRRFHEVLYAAAGSRRWLETIRSLWRRAERYMWIGTAMSGAIGQVQADHVAIVEACRRRDGQAAEEQIQVHLQRSEERLLREWAT